MPPRSTAWILLGVPGHPIEDLSLTDVFIDFAGGGTAEQATREVPDDEKAQRGLS
ncbi:MAG: hypothetical protein WDM96_17145 [Lacunisphaera sp.]